MSPPAGGIAVCPAAAPTQATQNLPLFFHVVSSSAGATPPDLPRIQQQIAELNARFALIHRTPEDNGIPRYQFYLAGTTYIVSDLYHAGVTYETAETMADEYAIDPFHVINIFVVPITESDPGFTYTPYGVLHGDPKGSVYIEPDVLSGGPASTAGLVLQHEVGHYLGLPHIDQYGPGQGSCSLSYVPPACTMDGDGVCDTSPMRPAQGCTPAGCANAPAGAPPLPQNNLLASTLSPCATNLTQGQVRRLVDCTADLRPDLSDGAPPALSSVPAGAVERRLYGGVWQAPSTGDLVVEAGATLVVSPGTRLQFAAGKGITVYGTLAAAGATLNAVSPGAGWSGIAVYAGGSASLTAGTVVERVGTPSMYGGGAVRAFGGTLVVDNSRIETPAGLGLIYGVHATAGAQVVVRNGSFVEGYPLGGLYAGNSAWVQAWGSTVRQTGRGLQASGATLWASDMDVTDNTEWGAYAGPGHISFAGPLTSVGQPPVISGENTVMNLNTMGDLYASSATYTSGSSSSYRKNSFTSASQQVRLLGESSAVLVANWWGQTTGPAPSRVEVAPKSWFEFCPWLLGPAGPLYSGGCVSSGSELGRSAGPSGAVAGRGTESGADPLGSALDALDAVDAGTVFARVAAVLDSLDASAPDSVVVLRSIPVVTAALRYDDRPEGYALLDRLAARGAARGTAGASPLASRLRALAALGRGPEAARAAAEPLTAASATAPTGHAILALAALAEGDLDAALAALESAEAALTTDHTPDDAAFVASVRADVAAARGTSSGVDPGAAEQSSEVDMPAGRLAVLSAVRPNPTGGPATLDVTLAAAARLDAEVFDGLGRRVAVLAAGEAAEGSHALALDTSGWAPGVYSVRVVVRADGQSHVLARRVVVTR